MEATSGSSTSQQRQNRVPCANVKQNDEGSTNCDQKANLECGKCHLVHYCDQSCQIAHWPQHKLDCDSELRKVNWKPTWDREGRFPSFLLPDAPIDVSGYMRYFWSNVPAFDVLNLPKNEGAAYDRDMNICFAASGDPRNLIQSVLSMPANYSGIRTYVMNDFNQVVACRNVILLLIAALLPPAKAADLMLHVWYSGRITSGMLDFLKGPVRTLIADVVEKIKSKGDNILLSKTWTFGSMEVSGLLYKQQWSFLLKMLDACHEVTETEKHRLHIVLNRSHLDHQERQLYFQSPAGRVCSHKMRKTGVLVPFGMCLEQFQCSNPTLFDPDTSEWLQQNRNDPAKSWSIEAVQVSGLHHGIPQADQYGLLYFYIRDKLEQFCRSTASANKLRFRLYCVDAADLSIHINNNPERMKFDRVEAGSIVSMGLGKALQKCGSLLKSSAENPHATLIVLFMNGTHLAENALGNDYFVRTCPSIMKPTLQFVPGKLRPGKASALTVHRLQAKELLRDLDHLFTHHMRMKDFDKASREAGLKMKAANTVVDEWPLRLRKEYGEPGAQEDFDRLIVSGSRGDERYVEWVRSG